MRFTLLLSDCSPCFAGRSYATAQEVAEAIRNWSCSPCFAGRSYATEEPVFLTPFSERQLQSLFCWKVVCNLGWHLPGQGEILKVAVLVLLEGRMQLC